MSRATRTMTALVAGCGLAFTIAMAALAQEQTEHRVEIIRRGGPGAMAAETALPHVAPFPAGEHDIIIARPGGGGVSGAPGAGSHSAEVQAALGGPAGALSTPDMLIRHSRQLELTDDQVVALKSLRVAMRKMHVRASAEIQLAEIDLEAAADVAQPNMDALEAAFMAVAKARIGEQMLPFRTSREAREALTDAQLAKWDGFLAQRHDAEAMHRAHASMMPGRGQGAQEYTTREPGAEHQQCR